MSDDASIFDESIEPDDGDSQVFPTAPQGLPPESILKIYSVGEITVVGFGGKDIPDETCIAGYRDQLAELVEKHDVKTIAFDLSGVTFVPSGMLGVLLSLKKGGQNVELYNPSDDVRDVLSITKLEQLFTIKEVDVESL